MGSGVMDTQTMSIEATSSEMTCDETMEINRWPELPEVSRYIKRAGWQRRSMPEILMHEPDHVVVSDKLRQILAWSMLPGTSWAEQPERLPALSVIPIPSSESAPERTNNVTALNDTDTISMSSRFQGSEDGTAASTASNTEKSAWKSRLKNKITRKALVTDLSPRPPLPTAECTCCFDDVPLRDLVRLQSCRHYYCKTCLTSLITTAMTSESSFPPKCCLTAIPLQTILLSLSATQREVYKAKSAEYSIPANERWYCPKPNCNKWIPPSKTRNHWGSQIKCTHCSEKICRTCRGTAHASNTDCPQDYGLEATLEIADIEGWIRCYKCRAVVEHTAGCRHMTCKCGGQFCYVCGVKWETCRCTESDVQAKKANAQARKEARYAIFDEEAAEIARAIAELQEMELREAEARRLEDERIALEEQAQLEALEIERLAEEKLRKDAAEQAEKNRVAAIYTSFEEEYKEMCKVLTRIVEHQKQVLHNKHDNIVSTKIRDAEPPGKAILEELADRMQRLTEKYQSRRASLAANQQEEICALVSQNEDEEDDLFIQVQMRLRGKPNKEARTERMLEELRKQQGERLEDIQRSHADSTARLQTMEEIDLEGLRRARLIEQATSRQRSRQITYQLGFAIGADREYFETVTARRWAMLILYKQLATEQMEQGLEPTDLLDWQAATCEPRLPETDDGAPGPSGIQRGRRSVALTGPSTKLCESQRYSRGLKDTPAERSTSIGYYSEQPRPILRDIAAQNEIQNVPGSFPGEDEWLSLAPRGTFCSEGASSPLPALSHGSDSDDQLRRKLSTDSICVTPKSSFVLAREAMVVVNPDNLSDKEHYAQGNVPISQLNPESEDRYMQSKEDLLMPSRLVAAEFRVDNAHVKKSRWPFGHKSRSLNQEQVRQRMEGIVGDAL